MIPSTRRGFVHRSLALGGVALWGAPDTAVAEQGEAITAQNKHDTIRDIELLRIKTPRHRYFLWARIRTRNGLVGYGECYAVDSTTRWAAKYMKSLRGRNVRDLINRFYREAIKDYDPRLGFYGNMGWCSAASCIEIALWDILGKMADQPVHVLLGGALRDRVSLYANHAGFIGKGPGQHERILRAKELGFDMFKWDPFRGAPEDEATIRKQLEPAVRAREALGPDFKLAIDAHRRWKKLEPAKLAAKLMEPLKLEFFEEPMPHDRIDDFVELAKSTDIPIATGELMTHPDEVRDLVKTGSLAFLQPDVGNIGGIAAMKNACHVADTFGVNIYTHNWSGPISTLAAVHHNAVIPNLTRQEWPHLAYGEDWETRVVAPQLVAKQGHVAVPQGPGLGVDPDMKMLERLAKIVRD